MIERDEKGDEDDRPLSMKIVKPTKKSGSKKKKSKAEPVGVGR